MRAAAAACAMVVLAFTLAVPAQVRVERDAHGNIVITNRKPGGEKAGSHHPIPKVTTAQQIKIRKKLRRICSRRKLDFHLVSAVVRAESDFRQYILSRKGAIGLMQLMPATAKEYGVHDPWNVEQNLSGGTAFLKDLLKHFKGNIPLALAAYNAGPDAVARYGNRIPPYRETVHYVFTILHDYGRDGLVDKARALLYRASDYQRFYLATRGETPEYTVFYMSREASGAWHIYDYPPAGIKTVPVVVKEDW